MRNYSYSGQSITFIAPEPLVSGQIYVLGSAVGVVANSLQKGESGELFVTGVWNLPKDLTNDIKVGEKLYLNQDNRLSNKSAPQQPDSARTTSTSTPAFKVIGIAAGDSSLESDSVLCRLNGVAI